MHRNEREIAAILLEAGADPNLKDSEGRSTISAAITSNNPETLELLVNYPKSDLCLPVSSLYYTK